MSTPGQGSVLGSPIIYAKVDYGPTLGQVYRPVNQKRVVTAAGTDTVLPFDQTVIYRKTVPAAFQVILPDLGLWMTQPYGGFDLCFIDGVGNAATYPITFVPFGSQTIDGVASNYAMNVNNGSLVFVPLIDRSGWELLFVPSAGGGSGGALLIVNNLSDIANTTLSRDNLGVEIGVDVQAWDAELAAIAGLTSAADKLPYFTGSGTAALTTLTAAARTVLDDTTVAAMRTTLEVDTGSIEIIIGGSGSVLTTGLKGYLPEAPFGCTITQATLVADVSGSVVVNIWKCTYAQFDAGATHPVSGDKITASAPPTITTATKSQDSTLTGWTTAIAAGDILAFNIDSVTTITRIALSLKYTKG